MEENIISNESVIETTKEQDTEGLSEENAENAETDVLSSVYIVYFSRADVLNGAGAGQIGMAIARRIGTGKKIVVGDKKLENAWLSNWRPGERKSARWTSARG